MQGKRLNVHQARHRSGRRGSQEALEAGFRRHDKTMTAQLQTVDGMRFDRGYLSPLGRAKRVALDKDVTTTIDGAGSPESSAAKADAGL